MNKNLLIIGAGQYGFVAKEIAEATHMFNKIDFLDDVKEHAIAKTYEYERYVSEYSNAICAIGNAEVRLEWIRKLKIAGYRVPTLVHPKAYVSVSAKLEEGTIVEPMAVVQANSTILQGGFVSANATVNHNSYCFEVCHIDCGSVVPANTIVPPKTKVGCGLVYRETEKTS